MQESLLSLFVMEMPLFHVQFSNKNSRRDQDPSSTFFQQFLEGLNILKPIQPILSIFRCQQFSISRPGENIVRRAIQEMGDIPGS
jgi:hypothetical protein